MKFRGVQDRFELGLACNVCKQVQNASKFDASFYVWATLGAYLDIWDLSFSSSSLKYS